MHIHCSISGAASDQSLKYKERVEQLTWLFRKKGFGDRGQELSFISKFFQEIFTQYPQLESFEWNQYQDYNDEYFAFDIESYKINAKYSIDIYGFDWWDDDDWNYRFSFADENEWKSEEAENQPSFDSDPWEKMDNDLQRQLAHLREPANAILIFLKACYDFYKPYYFIYVFGRRAKVTITRNGISVNTQDIDYINGDKDDKVFNDEV